MTTINLNKDSLHTSSKNEKLGLTLYVPIFKFEYKSSFVLGAYDSIFDAKTVIYKYISSLSCFDELLKVYDDDFKQTFMGDEFDEDGLKIESDYFWEFEEFGLKCEIVVVNKGTLFDFYHWDRWTEMKELYKVIKSVLKGETHTSPYLKMYYGEI